MARVRYNQSLYRNGFRPYGKTNPFAATQMNGLGGLGDIVPNGSIVTYQGQWQVANIATQKPSDILAAVSAALNTDGFLIRRSSSDASFWSTDVAGNPFNVTLQLQVNNGMGYGQPSDIISVIRHEYYVATGLMPMSDQISVNSIPGGLSTPDGTNPGTQDWSSWLQDNALWIGLAVAGIVIVPDLLRDLL